MLIELLAVAVLGQEPEAAQAVTIGASSWRSAPTPSWPRGGKEMDIVRATVIATCTAGPEGRVLDCSIESESPRGYGFGREVLASTSAARLSTTAESYASGGPIRFAVHFHDGDVSIMTLNRGD